MTNKTHDQNNTKNQQDSISPPISTYRHQTNPQKIQDHSWSDPGHGSGVSAFYQKPTARDNFVTLERHWADKPGSLRTASHQATVYKEVKQKSPMDRWLLEDMDEEPYHNIAAVAQEPAAGGSSTAVNKDT